MAIAIQETTTTTTTARAPYVAPREDYRFHNISRKLLGALREYGIDAARTGRRDLATDTAKWLRETVAGVPCIGAPPHLTAFAQSVMDAADAIRDAVSIETARRARRPACDIGASALASAVREVKRVYGAATAILTTGERVPLGCIDDLDEVAAVVAGGRDITFEAGASIVQAWCIQRAEDGEPAPGVEDVRQIAAAGTAPIFVTLVEDDMSADALRIAISDAAAEWDERA